MTKAYEEDLKEERETWKARTMSYSRALDRALGGLTQIEDAMNASNMDQEYFFRIIFGVRDDVKRFLSDTGSEPVGEKK